MIKRIIGVSVAILFVWVVAGRLAPPTAERRDALRLLNAPMPPVAGRDGSDALWLLPYDVPASEQARVAAQTRRYLDAADTLRAEGRTQEREALKDPRAAYPRFKDLQQADWLCETDAPDCLAVVRRDPAAAAAALQDHQRGLAAVDRLLGFDGARLGVAPSMTQDLPRMNGQRRLARTRFALNFVQGDHEGALAGTCRDIAGWRRLGADTDILITSMVGAAYVRQDLRLLAEMLAELDATAPLPEACALALAPSRDQELGLCLAVRGDYRAIDRSIRTIGLPDTTPGARTLYRIALDGDHAMAVVAPAYARYCTPASLAAAKADRSQASLGLSSPRCSLWERVPDPVGCILADSHEDYLWRYVDRRTDLAAQLALMRTVVWLRTQDTSAGSRASLLARRPAELGLRRAPQLSNDGRGISIPLLDGSREPRFELRLPPA